MVVDLSDSVCSMQNFVRGKRVKATAAVTRSVIRITELELTWMREEDAHLSSTAGPTEDLVQVSCSPSRPCRRLSPRAYLPNGT